MSGTARAYGGTELAYGGATGCGRGRCRRVFASWSGGIRVSGSCGASANGWLRVWLALRLRISS
eukprot:3721585-Rhodomonas_salina.1